MPFKCGQWRKELRRVHRVPSTGGTTPRTNARKETPMNWDQVAGNWKQLKGKVKEKWGDLNDDDLTYIDGKRDQLIGRVQERYGIAKDEAERQVKAWENMN
jgi:uncharacterized protein YjbJ (UPF0337 family)